MPTRDEIFEKVRATLVDALCVDDEDVTETARLSADLGAESIDFLDIVFRLEKNFATKIPRGELFPENFAAAGTAYVANGLSDDITIIDMETMRPVKSLAVGRTPHSVRGED